MFPGWPLVALAVAQAVPLEVHGFVDAYYAFNLNRPADGSNFAPGMGTTAHRAGEISLNLAAIDVGMKPQPVGFRVVLGAGTGASQLVQQASAMWEPTPRWHVEAGIYPSHIGFETLLSKDNWTYTRGDMGELSPYLQAGVMVRYAFTDQLSAQVHLINGWQVIGDDNRSKAVGTQVAWSTDALSVAFNTCIGPELPGDDHDWRFFGDLVATLKPTSKLSVAVTADAAFQQPAATWKAIGVLGRYAFDAEVAVAGRAEIFDDPDGAISGLAQRLWEGTATLEVRPAPALIVKLEARYDQSTAAAFTAAGAAAKSELLAVLGTVAAF